MPQIPHLGEIGRRAPSIRHVDLCPGALASRRRLCESPHAERGVERGHNVCSNRCGPRPPGGRALSVASPRRTVADLLIPVLLFATVVAYLAHLPQNLSPADESSYLHEAKRLLAGEVMYRDVFDFITPGFQYLMAFLFGVFGTTIETARGATAVIHGLTAVALYAACRRLGARPWLALAAGLAHLTLDQSSWPIASQHWLSTLLCTLLLCCYARGGVDAPAQTIDGAVVLGLLVLVQQQRGVPMVAGTAVWLVADALLARRYGHPVTGRDVVGRLLVFAGAIAAVSVPVLAWIVVRAGFPAVWSALVEFPISSYGATTQCEWGHVNIMTALQASFTFARVLTWLPLGLAVTIPRLVWLAARRRDEATARRLAWLVACAGSSALSIRYFPDFIHIAFIAPPFYAIVAENLEAAARALGRVVGGLLVAVAVTGFIVVSGLRLTENHTRLWANFPFPVQTDFGRIDFRADRKELQVYESVRRLTDEHPGLELFVYPSLSQLYLMTSARNPTRYSWYGSTFGFPDLLVALEAHRPPYAMVVADWKPNDPIIAYVLRTYEPPPPGTPLLGALLRRRPDA